MRPIAAFDFDGTITRNDTMYPFLRRVVGVPRLMLAAASDLPRLMLAAAGRGDRDAAKARLFARVLAGRDTQTIHDAADEHARAVLATQIRPTARERIDWHREAGHELVIVSASLDVYLTIIGPALGFDRVVCTELETLDGRLTGAMRGGNCRGAAKVARLRAAVDDLDQRELWAYGDSSGDDELLAAAQHAFRMHRNGTLTPRTAAPA
jgi:HAD superfamily hydrolase (TIGR01490 family)